MIGGRRGLPKDYYRGRHQSVGELYVGWAEPVYMQQRHTLGEVASNGRTVVHIHKLRRDQPNGQASLFHPIVAKQQEIAVQPGETADVQVKRLGELGFESVLVAGRKVVMPHVRRVCEHQIEALLGWKLAREVTLGNFQSTALPQLLGGSGENRIEFDTSGGGNVLGDRTSTRLNS